MQSRLSWVLIPLLLAAAPAPAQEVSRIRMGLVGGFTTADLSGVEVPGSTVATSARNGFLLRYRVLRDVNARVALGAGLSYARRGGKVAFIRLDEDAPEVEITQNGELTLDYLEVPLLVRADLFAPAGFTVSLHGGPTLGIRTTANYDLTDVRQNTRTGEVEVVTDSGGVGDSVGRVDLGGTVGVEVGRPVGDVVVSVVAEFAIGLRDAVDGASGAFLLSSGKNQGLAFAVGLTSRL